jgi:putative hydrolase of the HAD superfamily
MSKFTQIKHIFFDLDHTLWDFNTNSKKAYQNIFEINNVEIDINKFITIYEPINFNYWKLYREEQVTKEELRYGRIKETFNKLNFSINDSLIDVLSNQYLEQLTNYNQLFDGTIELLNYLKPKYNLHIVTNGFSETQLLKLDNSNLSPFFDLIVTSENVGVKKPNPNIFFYALKMTKAKTYESVMIGDNLEADIYGAKNVGMKVIHCNFEKRKAIKNVTSVTHLNQIKQYL